jgi:acyl-CoA reductase-like NAD-dependent aldehyde dehydrogenase
MTTTLDVMTTPRDQALGLQVTQTIDGVAVASAYVDVINPATGAPFQRAPWAVEGDLDRAVAAARKAQPGWAAISWEKRAERLEQFAQAVAAERELLAALLTLEQGKPLPSARGEIEGTLRYMRTLSAVRVTSRVLADDGVKHVVEQWTPKGVVGAIAPWNAPVILGMVKIVTALIGGNTIVIKPSELTPLCTLEIGRIGRGIFPPGVFNVLCGGRELGAAMAAHPGFDKLSFTGSTATGLSIAKSAATALRSVTLELGGNDAAILLPDGSIPALVATASQTGFSNCGQFCAAIKRIYAPRDMYDAVCEQLAAKAKSLVVGDGFAPAIDIGPIQNKTQYDKVCAIVEDAKAQGGRILAGGAPLGGPGYFFPPTVVADLTDGVRLVDEEQFGPVIPVIAYDDLEGVIATVNAGEYGLTGSVWTADLEKGAEVVSRLEVGTGFVNQHGAFDSAIPMPLIKHSGMGVDYGDYGVKGAMNVQIINIRKSA